MADQDETEEGTGSYMNMEDQEAKVENAEAMGASAAQSPEEEDDASGS